LATRRLHPKNAPLTPNERTMIASEINSRRYWLLAYVVMDNHVHVLLRLTLGNPFQKTVHRWNSYAAKQLQRHHDRKRAVWQDESFDRRSRCRRTSEHTQLHRQQSREALA
jgi:REP element-mobilizing transposase RayT